jgi:NAD+ kinase
MDVEGSSSNVSVSSFPRGITILALLEQAKGDVVRPQFITNAIVEGDHIKVTASKYPFPTVSADKASTDWFNSISRTLRWNEREKQKSFVVVEEEHEPAVKGTGKREAEQAMFDPSKGRAMDISEKPVDQGQKQEQDQEDDEGDEEDEEEFDIDE